MASSPTAKGSTDCKWNIVEVRRLVQEKFGKVACLFQVQIALALNLEEKDVVGVAPKGAGKTLTFWLPLIVQSAIIPSVPCSLDVEYYNVSSIRAT